MDAENIFELILSFIVFSLCALIMIVVGISQIKNTAPVGFWNWQKPPKRENISDLPAYNRKHGLMWILYGLGMIICFLFGMLFKDGLVFALTIITEICGGIMLMALYHKWLVKKYWIK